MAYVTSLPLCRETIVSQTAGVIFSIPAYMEKKLPNELYSVENIFRLTYREIFSESCYSKPNLDYYYNFPVDLASHRISFGAKSIENEIKIQIWFVLTRFRKDL